MTFAATSSTSTTFTWFATGAAGKQKDRCKHLAMLLKGVFGMAMTEDDFRTKLHVASQAPP